MILIRYGSSNTREVSENDYPTTGSILNDTNIRQHLGFSANSEARVNGSSGREDLVDGDVVDIISRANTKG